MDPRQFVENRTRRYMAQALEEFENRVEHPLARIAAGEPTRHDIAAIVSDIDGVKRTFRKKLQALGTDCIDLIPTDVEINAVELVRRSA